MMRERWHRLWKRLGAAGGPDAVFEELTHRYAEAQRQYHTLAHIEQVLAEIDGVRAQLAAPDLVEAAAWFHDVVYDPRRSDNEEQSAAAARRALAGVGEERLAEIEAEILATRHNQPAVSGDTAFLVDADLSILGQPAEAFDSYEQQIRTEYGWVPEPQYIVGRRAVLQSLLNRDAIFATEEFRRRHEVEARSNIERALSRLRFF